METVEETKIPSFVELPFGLKQKLITEFLLYVFHQLRFRHYVMFFSFWALAYQTRNLMATYLEFQTVVKVEIIKPYTIDIPATTLCTDKNHMVLKSKLEERYSEIKERIERIVELNETTDEIMNIYREYKQKAYENSTIHEWFQLLVEPQMILECKLIIKPNYHSNHSMKIPDCIEFAEPYYSMPYGAGLCWTYFSQINPNNYTPTADRFEWYKVDIPEEGKIASFRVNFSIFDQIVYDEAPLSPENEKNLPEIYAIINNPKSMPSSISLDKAVVREGTNFEIYFSQTNAKLLRWPFRTNCVWYETEGIWKKFKSSDHCIDDCLTQKVIDECNCIFNESRGGRITKWAEPDSQYVFCKEYNLEDYPVVYPGQGSRPKRCGHRENYESHKFECNTEGKCNNNCYEDYYRYEVKEVFFDEDDDGRIPTPEEDEFRYGEPLFPKARANDSWATINIIRKDMADVTYEHTPEMVFVEFVCYFGGLLGLWLGVSILDMYHQCLIWWDEVPLEYRKWVQRQSTITYVQRFSAKQKHITLISDNYNSQNDYTTYAKNMYNTKY